MNVEPSAPQSDGREINFAVEFGAFTNREGNPDLKGNGLFTAQDHGTVFRFTGRGRSLFDPGRRELQFAATDVTNVGVNGKAVRFSTTLGRAGKLKRPFVFFCRDSEEASMIAALLPQGVDQDFVASRDFQEKLRQLPGAAHPWCSVTNILIGVNVAVFLIVAGFLGGGWIDVTDLTPYIRYGANNGAATTAGEWWRLITAMFLHYGILHLALNMWALFQIGKLVEKLLGRALYAFTYFAAGIGGGLLSLIWHGDKVWSVGASGAIFGVYGALLGYILRERQAIPRPVLQPLLKSTLMFAGYNLLFGFAHPQIDNSAHIGGFVTGIIFGWICALPLGSTAQPVLVRRRLAWAALALVLVTGVGVGLAPRFPYLVRDELAWDKAVTDFSARESPLVARQNAEIKQMHEKGDNIAKLIQFDEAEFGPFYAEYEGKIGALSLASGRPTDRRRQLLVAILKLKEEGLRHLVAGLRKKDEAEFQACSQTEAQATTLIHELQEMKN